MRGERAWVTAAVVFASAGSLSADLGGSYVLPLNHEAIQYNSRAVKDPVVQLQEALRKGEVKLEFEPEFGYLRSMLKALDVPLSSQVLVFSKTSFQAPRIAPRLPRAIYFNDTVTVGYVRGGDVLELTAVDAEQGVSFYTLEQEPKAELSFDRQEQCLQCHATGATLGVPGLVVRSVFPDRTGMPVFQAGTFVTDHRSPLKERWGGWYVTGSHGAESHMGNTLMEDKKRLETFDPKTGQNVRDLKPYFDTGAYVSPHSDIVALMVLEHQTRMQNLITRIGFESRIAVFDSNVMNKLLGEPPGTLTESGQRRVRNPSEELLRYLLFTDEAPLSGAVAGTSGFAGEYSARGPRDGKGRSLYELDLKTRLLKYPCSPLIYSASFDGLPKPARDYIYRRLWEVLSGQDTSERFARLSASDRRAILEILRDTKPGLPDFFQTSQ
jgi:hypothetical protein